MLEILMIYFVKIEKLFIIYSIVQKDGWKINLTNILFYFDNICKIIKFEDCILQKFVY